MTFSIYTLGCKVNSYDVNNLDDWEANHMGSLSKEDVHKIMNIIQG